MLKKMGAITANEDQRLSLYEKCDWYANFECTVTEVLESLEDNGSEMVYWVTDEKHEHAWGWMSREDAHRVIDELECKWIMELDPRTNVFNQKAEG